jgi:succinate-acetate transporter protein
VIIKSRSLEEQMAQEKLLNETLAKIKDTTGNPAPVGLIAFGMTTVLLNIHNAGFYPLNTMILAMGVFYGGVAQIIASVMEWKKGNTFGTTAFLSFGLFWLTLVALLLLPVKDTTTAIAVSSKGAMAAYFFMWGLFTLVMYIGTLRLNRALQVVFGSLTILFFLLCGGEATGNSVVVKIAGYEGILCGLSAIYAGLAQVLNEVYGRVVFSIGPVMKR